MTRTAIIAALPGELKPLVRDWTREKRRDLHVWRYSSGETHWVAACAGAGVQAATRAFAAAEEFGPISRVVSTGWAGALNGDLQSGHVYPVSGVIDARTGERFLTDDPSSSRWLVTSPRVADVSEKERLATAYTAALVDMEAAAVARLAEMRGIPFYCVKGVSDGFHDRLPDFNRFLSTSGQFHLAWFTLFALSHPRHWPGLLKMGENSRKAAQSIAVSLHDLLERGQNGNRNGYSNFKS